MIIWQQAEPSDMKGKAVPYLYQHTNSIPTSIKSPLNSLQSVICFHFKIILDISYNESAWPYSPVNIILKSQLLSLHNLNSNFRLIEMPQLISLNFIYQ